MVNVVGNVLAIGVGDIERGRGAESEIILKRPAISVDSVGRQSKVRLDPRPFLGYVVNGDPRIALPANLGHAIPLLVDRWNKCERALKQDDEVLISKQKNISEAHPLWCSDQLLDKSRKGFRNAALQLILPYKCWGLPPIRFGYLGMRTALGNVGKTGEIDRVRLVVHVGFEDVIVAVFSGRPVFHVTLVILEARRCGERAPEICQPISKIGMDHNVWSS
jgi:hypothetical protein